MTSGIKFCGNLTALTAFLLISATAFSEQPERETISKTAVPKKQQTQKKKPACDSQPPHQAREKSEKEFIEWLNEYYPKDAEKLESLNNKPGLYCNHFKLLRKKYGEIMDIQKRNPEFAKARMEDLKLLQVRDGILLKIQKTRDQKQKDSLTKQLSEVVSKRFDLTVKIKKFRYEELRARIEQLSKVLAEREEEVKKLQERKDVEIKNRVQELIKNRQKDKKKADQN